MLGELGILSRDKAYQATFEDREFLHLFRFSETDSLPAAIAERNNLASIWGFKIPSLHGYLEPHELRAFRNPHLIIVFRDLVAVAQRHAIAELTDPLEAFFEASSGMSDLIAFLRATDCPALLVSYEKAVSLHDQFVTALAQFCGVPVDEAQRQRLNRMILPNNMSYADVARRRYEGNVDGIFDGCLVGWCRELDEPDPVHLDLLIDGIPHLSFKANRFRIDLRQAGIGHGSYAFAESLHALGLSPDAVLSVRVSGRLYELPGSGKSLWQYWR
ncbi:MAG TPA: hypothetical protein VIZ17_01135 [Acetobacteraceae bacterium]